MIVNKYIVDSQGYKISYSAKDACKGTVYVHLYAEPGHMLHDKESDVFCKDRIIYEHNLVDWEEIPWPNSDKI